jgi:zinc-ribbon domain
MDYQAQLKCKRPQCEGVLTIPIKILIRREAAFILTRCYKCRTKYKVIFSTLDRDQWIPLIHDLFNRCEVCGMVIQHEWNIYSASASLGGISRSGSSQPLHRNVGVVNPCPNCKRNSPKAIDDWLWSLFRSEAASSPKLTVPPSATNLFCSNCGSALLPGIRFCTNCGSEV